MTAMIIIAMFPQGLHEGGGSHEILLPPEHAGTTRDHLYLVGRSSAPEVTVHVNGSVVATVAVVDSVFHTQLRFGYGLNEVSVLPLFSGRAGSEPDTLAVEVLYAPRLSSDYSKVFQEYSFHGTEPPEICLGCHTPKESSLLADEDATWCYSCHREIQVRFEAHTENRRQTCVLCHRIGADLTLSVTGEYSDKNPCYTCHTDKIGTFTQDYIHGPVASGACTVCHEPHGSIYESNLVQPVPILCPSCHGGIEDEPQEVRHEPFAMGRCPACHDPHSTNNRWVLIKESKELCTSCHGEEALLRTHNHPFNVKPKKRLARPLKLTEEGELECLSCHDAHASTTAHLLRTTAENSCQGCHPNR